MRISAITWARSLTSLVVPYSRHAKRMAEAESPCSA